MLCERVMCSLSVSRRGGSRSSANACQEHDMDYIEGLDLRKVAGSPACIGVAAFYQDSL